MLMVTNGRAMVRWQQPDIRNRKATNSWDDIGEMVDRMAEELSLLDQLAGKRTADFKIAYHQGFNALLPMLAPMKQASQRLGYATVFALNENDTDAATAHIRGMIGATRMMKDERLIISQLVRISMAQITQTTIWEFLQSTNVTDAQLAVIQKDWAELEFAMPMARALEMERAMSQAMISEMRESRAGYDRAVSGMLWGGKPTFTKSGDLLEDAGELVKIGWKNTIESSREGMWRAVWSYPDQLRSLKGSQILLETLRMAETNGNFGAAREFQSRKFKGIGLPETDDEDWFSGVFNQQNLQYLFSGGLTALGRTFKKVIAVQAAKQLTLTAIALKRHQLRHGKLPETLNALAPEFLPAVPLDPVNAQPLHYRPNADGTFLLYSVGEDGEDNGGNPKPVNEKAKSNSWQNGRDWVWPQPASPQEIEEYFENPHR
jgi:hypothetical protein